MLLFGRAVWLDLVRLRRVIYVLGLVVRTLWLDLAPLATHLHDAEALPRAFGHLDSTRGGSKAQVMVVSRFRRVYVIYESIGEAFNCAGQMRRLER